MGFGFHTPLLKVEFGIFQQWSLACGRWVNNVMHKVVQDLFIIDHNDMKCIWSFDNMDDYFLLVRHDLSGLSLLSFQNCRH